MTSDGPPTLGDARPLAGHTALVTGAGAGIGTAIARELARRVGSAIGSMFAFDGATTTGPLDSIAHATPGPRAASADGAGS